MRRDDRYGAVLMLAAALLLAFVMLGPGGVVFMGHSGAASADIDAQGVVKGEEPDSWRQGRQADAPAPSGARFPGLPLDLNTATRDELMTLPGIGVKTAERIIEQRVNTGGFTDLSELRAIEWLGKGRLERLRGLVYVKVLDPDAPDDPASPGPAAIGK